MHSNQSLLATFLALFLLMPHVTGATAFVYQGQLDASGQPQSGPFDLAFSLYPALEGAEPLGTALTNTVQLDEGRFTTTLDFGAGPFTGQPLWLEIGVRPAGSAEPFATLNPRQPVTPTPYALHALQATQSTLAEGVPPNSLTATHIAPQSLTGDRIADSQIVRSLNGLNDTIQIQAGDNLTLTTNQNILTLAGTYDWTLTGNPNTLPGKHFIGTTDLQPLELKVNNSRALRLEPTSFDTVVNVIGGSSGNYVRPGTTGATIAGGGAIYPEGSGDWTNAVHAEFGSIGGGYGNFIGTNASAATIAGGHLNAIRRWGYHSVISGGSQNFIDEDADRSVIGGGSLHKITIAAYGAVIDGGISNTVAGYFSAIGGGSRNSIASNARYATIAGGGDNQIALNSYSGAIGGGGENRILEDSHRSTIAGGKLNQVGPNSPHSTIGGGLSNQIAINTESATIPGGTSNLVSAPLSLAAGYRAQALHSGAFIWADQSPSNFTTSASNQFAVRATGGVRLVTGLDGNHVPLSGVELEPGSGSWSSLSDESSKANFSPADPRDILAKVASLPIHSWNYRTQPDAIRHLGPTAQSFHKAFGLGADPLRISSVDADGVALAAIQGLHQELTEKSQRIAALESQNAALEKRLEILERQIQTP